MSDTLEHIAGLECECPRCDRGLIWDRDQFGIPIELPCPDCDGSGSKLTLEGRRLMEFIRRHSQVQA